MRKTRKMRRIESRKRFRKKVISKCILFIVPIFLISILTSADTINAVGRSGTEDTGNLTISKTAEATGVQREFEITLKVDGPHNFVGKPIDVIVVVDTSGSMDLKIGNKTRLEIVKEHLELFYSNISSKYSNAKFSLVSFDGKAPSYNINYTEASYAENIKSVQDSSRVICDFNGNFEESIKLLSPAMNSSRYSGGYTNTYGALEMVQQLLTNRGEDGGVRQDSTPYVVFFTDGVPTANASTDNINDILRDGKQSGNIIKIGETTERRTYEAWESVIAWDINDGSDILGYSSFVDDKDENGNIITSAATKRVESRKIQYRINSVEAAMKMYDEVERANPDVRFTTIGFVEGYGTDFTHNGQNFITNKYTVYGKEYNDIILARQLIPYMQNTHSDYKDKYNTYPYNDYLEYPYYIENNAKDPNNMEKVLKKLQESFKEISESIIEEGTLIATPLVIEDTVTADFTIVPETIKAYDGRDNRELLTSEYDLTGTDITANKVKCTFNSVLSAGVYIKFKVRPVNDYFGGSNIDTNVEATLDYTDPNGENKHQTFEKPNVDLDFIEGTISIIKNIEEPKPSDFNNTTFPATIEGGVVNKKLGVDLEVDKEEKFTFTLIDENTRITEPDRNYMYIGNYNNRMLYTVKELVPMNYELVGIKIKNNYGEEIINADNEMNYIETDTMYKETDKFILDKNHRNVEIIITNKISNDSYFYDRDSKPNSFGTLIPNPENNTESEEIN